MRRAILAVLVLFLVVNFSYAAERGTAKDATNLVNKALAYFKANGKDKTFAAINDPKGQFVNRELYVFAIDWNGVIIAHGANKSLINRPTGDMKDSDGKMFMRDMVNVAKTKGKGWVDYKWSNPETKKIEQKSSYVVAVPGQNFLFGCGIYK